MTLKEKLKSAGRVLSAGALAMYLSCVPAYAKAEEPKFEPAAKGSVEINPGHQTTTLDLRLGVNPAPKLKVLNRHRVTSNYQGDINTFHYLAVGGELLEGLILGGGAWGTSVGGVQPHIALHYVGNWKDFSMFQLLSVTTEEAPVGMTLTNLNYHPQIADNWKFISELEAVTIADFSQHQFSTQRLRVGVGYKNLQFGAAGDLIEKGNIDDTGKAESFDYNFGGFVRLTF